MLNKQLGAVALLNPSNSGRTDADLAFNDGGCLGNGRLQDYNLNIYFIPSSVWANNGDAISRA